MNDVLLDWIGYVASGIVLVSLLMSSIKKLRWINLIGAVIFGMYGFMIHSLPTGFMNVGIAVIDAVFLIHMYFSKEYFTILPIDDESVYLEKFLDFYKNDISFFTNVTNVKADESEVKLYILRNMIPAGVFIGYKASEDTLEIRLDYAIPQYRDFKLGTFIFESQKTYFKELGFNRFVAYGEEKKHITYLEKMGFSEAIYNNQKAYVKEIK